MPVCLTFIAQLEYEIPNKRKHSVFEIESRLGKTRTAWPFGLSNWQDTIFDVCQRSKAIVSENQW